jgi:colanic acid/amylovoran biosynthesis protein
MQEADLALSLAGDAISQDYAYKIRFYEFWLLKKFATPNILYAQSVGPFDGNSRKPATKALNNLTAIIARDDKTIDLMKEYGVNVTILKSVDSAICLPTTPTKASQEIIDSWELKDNKVAGIVIRVNQFTGYTKEDYEVYLQGMLKVVENLKSKNYQLVLLSTIDADTRAAKEFKDKFELELAILELLDLRPTQVKAILSHLQFVISPRMHPIILSSTSSGFVPVIGLGREFKMQSYLSMIGCQDLFLPMIPLDKEKLFEKIEYLETNYDSLQSVIRSRVEELVKVSQNNINLVESILNEQK